MNPYNINPQQSPAQPRPGLQPGMHPTSWHPRGMPPPPGVSYPGMPQVPPGQHHLQMGRPMQMPPPVGYMRGPPLPHTAPPGVLGTGPVLAGLPVPRPTPSLNPVPPLRPTAPILPRPPGPPQPVKPSAPRVSLPTATPPVAPLPKINMPLLPPAQLSRLPVPGEKGHTTVYVGKISSTVDDMFLKAVLELCGSVKSWKRAEDPTTGTPKGFGFCEFESADGVLRALRLLNKYSLDGQDLVLNVNQATRDYLERYVQRRKEIDAHQKSSVTAAPVEVKPAAIDGANGGVQEEQSSDLDAQNSDAGKEGKDDPVVPLENESAKTEGAPELEEKKETKDGGPKTDDPKKFGLVDQQDEEADARAVEKLKVMLDERALVMPPLPPPPSAANPPSNVEAVPSETGPVSDSKMEEEDSKAKEGSDNDGSKLDAKGEDSASGLKKSTPEPEATETSSIDKSRKGERDRDRESERDRERDHERDREREYDRDRRHRDRDRDREKDGERDRNRDRDRDRERDRSRDWDRGRDRDRDDRELVRIEAERERQRMRRESGAREAERLYEEMERDWERREKEKELMALKDREREKEREKDRRWEIKQQEEESDDEDWHDRSRWTMRYEERRKRRQREREEDELDRLMEEQQLMEAKRRRLEEEKVEAAEEEVKSPMKVEEQEPQEALEERDEQPEEREMPPAPAMDPVMEDLSPTSERDGDTKMEDVEEEQNGALLLQPQDRDGHPSHNGNVEVKVEMMETSEHEKQLHVPSVLKKDGSGISGSGKAALATIFSSGHDEDEDEGHKKLRPLVPLEYSEEEKRGALNPPAGVAMPTPTVVPDLAAAAEFARSITAKAAEAKLQDVKEERKDKVKGRSGAGPEKERREKEQLPKAKGGPPLLDAKALIDSIPKTKDELFGFPVNWEVYDKYHLDDRMRPWISKKIFEFLGEEESTLVDFIVNNMAKHTNAVGMLGLLENIIDEEAEMFVLKMWRMLIFEIRRVETGLAKG